MHLRETWQVDSELNPLPGSSSRDPTLRSLHMLAKTLKPQWARIAQEEEERGLTRGFVTMKQKVVGLDGVTRYVGVLDAWSGQVLAVAGDSAVYDAGLKIGYRVIALDGMHVSRDMITTISSVKMANVLRDDSEKRGRQLTRLTVEHHDTEVRDDMLVVKMRVSCSAARAASLVEE